MYLWFKADQRKDMTFQRLDKTFEIVKTVLYTIFC